MLDPMPRPPIRFTREDYEQLPEHIPAELIEGDLVMISAPTPWNEGLAAELQGALRDHLQGVEKRRVLGSRLEISVWH